MGALRLAADEPRVSSGSLHPGLLRDVLIEHGYFSRWGAVTGISASVRFGGLAFASRMRRGCPVPRRVVLSAHEPVVRFDGFPTEGAFGIFTPSRVAIETSDGSVLVERDSPRSSFASFRHHIYWDRLDLLYFSGYACWNYLTSPFNLARADIVSFETDPWIEKGELFRRLRVTFPWRFPTHSEHQTFYFDEKLRVRRHDYDPQVFASWARAAHYCSEFREFDGFTVATRREVYPRASDGTSRAGPRLVWIDLEDVRFL